MDGGSTLGMHVTASPLQILMCIDWVLTENGRIVRNSCCFHQLSLPGGHVLCPGSFFRRLPGVLRNHFGTAFHERPHGAVPQIRQRHWKQRLRHFSAHHRSAESLHCAAVVESLEKWYSRKSQPGGNHGILPPLLSQTLSWCVETLAYAAGWLRLWIGIRHLHGSGVAGYCCLDCKTHWRWVKC